MRVVDPKLGVRLTGKAGRWAFGGLALEDRAEEARIPTDAYENVGLDHSASPALSRIGSLSTPTGRQIFVKLSYLFRF